MARQYVKKTKEERQEKLETKLARLERRLVLNDTRAQKYSDSLEPLRTKIQHLRIKLCKETATA